MASCVVVCLTAGTACSSDPPDTLTCEWLAMEDNCWKTTARAAVACLPPEADRGNLSADNATCTYPGGQVATFTPPIDLLGDDDPVQNFTIKDANGAACVQWQEIGDSGFTLTVQEVRPSGRPRPASPSTSPAPTAPDSITANALDLPQLPGTGLLGHRRVRGLRVGLRYRREPQAWPAFDAVRVDLRLL